jgi:hypothetical protein
MANIHELSLKELREIDQALGITYLRERKKAELIGLIEHEYKLRNFVPDPSKKIVGTFLDGYPIYEEDKNQ